MPLTPKKFDPKQELLEEIKDQSTYTESFFITLDKFIYECQRFDLDSLSEELREFFLKSKELRNEVSKGYEELKKSLENESHIIVSTRHNEHQKLSVRNMDSILEDLPYVRLPKEIDDSLKNHINNNRTQSITILNKIRDDFYYNDLGHDGGDIVLS